MDRFEQWLEKQDKNLKELLVLRKNNRTLIEKENNIKIRAVEDKYSKKHFIERNYENIFGKNVIVYYFESLLRSEKDVDANNVYHFSGYKAQFSVRETTNRHLGGDSYSSMDEDRLKTLEEITEEQFIKYLNLSSEITKKLEGVIHNESI